MFGVLASVSPLVGGVGVLLLGGALLNTLLGVRLADMGVGATVSALVMAAYYAGLIGGALGSAKLLGRIGHIRSFATLAALFSAATLAHAFLVDPWSWAVLRLIEGFSMAGLITCTESWLNMRATEQTRGTIFSVYMIATYFSQGIAQFLLTFGDSAAGETGGFRLYALVGILTTLSLVPIAVTRMPAPEQIDTTSLGLRKLYKISPTGVFGCLTSGMTLGSFYSLGPLFAREIGFDLAQIATFMSAVIIGGLILQWPLGRLSDRFDRRLIIIGACLAVAVTCLALGFGQLSGLPLASGSFHQAFLGGSVLFGALVATLYPVSVASANDRLAPADMVAASGGLLFSYSLGAMIGPLIASSVMEGVGPGGLFLCNAAIATLMALYTLRRIRLRDPAPEDERVPFQIVTNPLPMASAGVDVRSDIDDRQMSFAFSDSTNTAAPPRSEAA
ncbi:MFS transporter [Rhodospirillum rubrum]|uniref:MFS transporter n=1 Tax=Rhodospirillum rubrum TaxID=1085 RepID=UPI001908D47F|nr:MFS transporter [Rhodospirillum rubrum]MBK1666166.1 MFS transporter [Rhodospirillum rubrum]MBK1678277.1 MFS transporter [Rhodospirillum rubrum]